ncbi:hypothetical protein DFH29DRAFT_636448 [Suillus ampliporus]|nr:hypothetical protein DFH29DRAFT_636448 [Suillus ampliporus]
MRPHLCSMVHVLRRIVFAWLGFTLVPLTLAYPPFFHPCLGLHTPTIHISTPRFYLSVWYISRRVFLPSSSNSLTNSLTPLIISLFRIKYGSKHATLRRMLCSHSSCTGQTNQDVQRQARVQLVRLIK